ncbi:MAG TPA: NDP-sugar synthase [Thermoanaerobaculia bacterium]|jgi:NDP-sugar pyrophosphorylase family protein|nr:NDP-sugar synthase [Thermoanaerobaculia bacterium]
MQGRRLRALVLAAGLGTRLRPLTDLVPKPLLPVAGLPILGRTLAQLAALGCEEVAINLHHLGDQIRQRFGESFGGMRITWSEEPVLLGTLGAFGPLREFFAPAERVVLINGDSLCDWPLRRLLRRHLASGAEATLLLASRPEPADFGGGVAIDRYGRILSFRSGGAESAAVAHRYVFAGAHVIAPRLLKDIPPGVSDIVRDLYMPRLERGDTLLDSVVTARRWHDLGTPQRLLDGVVDWARSRWPQRLWRRSWISPEAEIGTGAVVKSSAVEAGARMAEGSRVERSLLLPGARVGKGCMVKDSIVGFGAAVPPGTWVERRVIMPQRLGFSPSLDDSVVGGAVFTPFG